MCLHAARDTRPTAQCTSSQPLFGPIKNTRTRKQCTVVMHHLTTGPVAKVLCAASTNMLHGQIVYIHIMSVCICLYVTCCSSQNFSVKYRLKSNSIHFIYYVKLLGHFVAIVKNVCSIRAYKTSAANGILNGASQYDNVSFAQFSTRWLPQVQSFWAENTQEYVYSWMYSQKQAIPSTLWWWWNIHTFNARSIERTLSYL